MKSPRPIKDVRGRKCRRPDSYYLGSAESPTSDSFSVRLKSSLSDGVASPPCSPQVGSALRTAQLIWAASLPYCTGLLYRHDLPEYSLPIKCSRPQIFQPFFWEKSKTQLGSQVSYHCHSNSYIITKAVRNQLHHF